jgi:hypothetical protein
MTTWLRVCWSVFVDSPILHSILLVSLTVSLIQIWRKLQTYNINITQWFNLEAPKLCSNTVSNALNAEGKSPRYEDKTSPLSTSPSACSNFKFEYSQLIGPLVGTIVMLVPHSIADLNPIGPAGVST